MAGGLSFSPLTLAIQEIVPREQLGQATSAIVFLRTGGDAGYGHAWFAAQFYGFQPMSGRVALALAASWACVPFRRGLSTSKL